MKNILCTLILAIAVAGSGQANPVARPSAVAAKPARALPDSVIEQNIRAKFAKSKINVEHFTVSVKNGVATIDGKTNVIQHKGVATRLAEERRRRRRIEPNPDIRRSEGESRREAREIQAAGTGCPRRGYSRKEVGERWGFNAGNAARR